MTTYLMAHRWFTTHFARKLSACADNHSNAPMLKSQLDCYVTGMPKKCHLFCTGIKCCAQILEPGTRRPAKCKVEAISG